MITIFIEVRFKTILLLLVICWSFFANAQKSCGTVPPSSFSQSKNIDALSCELSYKASNCDDYFSKNPEAKKHAIDCKDLDKWYAPAVGAMNFSVGCGVGAYETAKDLWEGITEAGQWLGEGAAKIEMSIQDKKDFESKCEKSLTCKTLLVSTLGLDSPPSTEQIQKMSMSQIMKLRRKAIGRQEQLDELFKLADKTPGFISNLGTIAKQSIENTGIKLACYNREKKNELLCYGALMVVDPTKYIKWFHRAREVSNITERESAFIAAAGTKLGAASKSEIIKKFEEAKELALAKDLKTPAYFEDGFGKTKIPVYKISEETNQKMKLLNAQIKADYEKMGYKVDTISLPATTYSRHGKKFELPEREVLQFSAGTANDSLSRELLRTEKWDTARRSESDFPSEIKPLRVLVDPIHALASEANASFNPHLAGPTIFINPNTLASASQPSEELLRHELRHLKAYYDIVSGKPTVYRGTLTAYGTKNLPPQNIPGYERFFAFDELEGFMSDLKQTNAKVGIEKENLRKSASAKVDISQDVKSYNERMTDLRFTANQQSRQINGFADSIENGIQTAREKIELAKSDQQFKNMININHEFRDYPGHQAVQINLTNSGSRDGSVLEVLVPTSKVKIKKPEEVRQYILNYLDDLEKETKKMREEAERRKKMIRTEAVDFK